MSIRLRSYLLPCSQIALAVLLGYLGAIQHAKEARGGILLDYVAPAEYALHIINMPAALAISGITRNWEFQIGLEHSSLAFAAYLLLIGLLWYSVARSFRRQPATEADNGRLSLFWDMALSAYCLACLLLSVMPLFAPVSTLFGLAAFVWDGTLLFLVGRRWLKRYRSSSAKTA